MDLLEALRTAIRSEVNAQKMYQKLAGQAVDVEVKALLLCAFGLTEVDEVFKILAFGLIEIESADKVRDRFSAEVALAVHD